MRKGRFDSPYTQKVRELTDFETPHKFILCGNVLYNHYGNVVKAIKDKNDLMGFDYYEQDC